MITHCPHCHTEFLLEDSELPAGGMSLQCASCRQVFGVLASPVGGIGGGKDTKAKPDATQVVAFAMTFDEDDTPAPAAPPSPNWQLKRESGEVVPVEDFNMIKQWIVDKRVRREDLLTQDGISWQRLANMRELIPSFELAGRRPEATQLVEREAFVVNVARGTDSDSREALPPDGRGRPARLEAADTWPGANAPLVTAEPTRPASTTYTHDKEHPFVIPISHVHRDYPGLWRRQQWARWALAGMMGCSVGVGLLVWSEPQWLHSVVGALYHQTVPEAAVTLVHQGYGQLYPDTIGSLQASAQTFKRAIALAGTYAEAHAGLAEAELSLAESYRQQAQDVLRGNDKKHLHSKQADQAAALEKDAASHLQAGMLAAQGALREAPESMAANRAMALYYEVVGTELGRAAPYLRQARAVAPDDVRVMYVDLNGGSVSPQAAIAAYRVIVERMPQFNRARYKLARLYMQDNDLEHASEQVAAIMASAPGHNLARWLLGDAPMTKPPASVVVSNLPTAGYGARGDTREAVPNLVPPPPGASYEVLTHQGQLLRATHQLPAAIALYERAIARDKRRPAGYIGMGWCQLDQEQSGPAMLNFTRATELSPWSVEAHYGLAEALRAQGDTQRAIKQYRQVLVIEPDGAMGRLARQVLDEISR